MAGSVGRPGYEAGTQGKESFKPFGFEQKYRSKLMPAGACGAEDREGGNSTHVMFPAFEGRREMWVRIGEQRSPISTKHLTGAFSTWHQRNLSQS